MSKRRIRDKIKHSIQLSLLFNCGLSFVIAYLVTAAVSIILFLIGHTFSSFAFLEQLLGIVLILSFTSSFLIIFIWLNKRIVTDLLNVEKGLEIMSKGDLDYKVVIHREDELGRVASNINRMAEQLQQKNLQERQNEQAKMELITGISHDLRTPLTSIIGYMELLRSHSFRDEQEYMRFVQNSYNKALHLKKMLDDLFEHTRLVGNEAHLHLEPIDITQLLNQLLFEFEPIAQENDITIVTKSIDLPKVIMMDNEKIARAIDNLLMNALKYSVKPGIVHVVTHLIGDQVCIEVENKGIPLTLEQEKRLFERFYKADDSRNHNGIQAGAGLGLSIARNIVELHEGTLRFEHTDGLFTFTICLPCE